MADRMIRRLLRDQQGAALVEFALLAPVLILFLLGSFSLIEGVEAQRRTSHVAYSIADVVAQAKTTDANDLRDVFSGGTLLMYPLEATGLGQRIFSAVADEKGNIKVTWLMNAPTGAYSGTAAPTLNKGDIPPNESAIVADVSYDYSPIGDWVWPGALKFQKRAILTPRLTPEVQKTDS